MKLNIKKLFLKLNIKRKDVPKWTLIAFGALILLNAFAVAVTSNLSFGTAATFLLGGFLLAWGIFYEWVAEKAPRWVIYAALALLAIAVIFISFLIFYGKSDGVSYDEDAVIVLGAGIHGETPSLSLQKRLDRAIAYCKENPNAVIVVSGGQGPREDITEALAMERYLTERGIPKERIIKEERSTSTRENFAYSKELLDGYFDGDYSVAFVTDDYHIYRASRYARMAGFEDTEHCHSNVKWYLILPNCLRECAAVLKLWVLGK